MSDTTDSRQRRRFPGSHDALRELEIVDTELAEFIEMRDFSGSGEAEIAELQGTNERTVRRRWDNARACLFVALGAG